MKRIAFISEDNPFTDKVAWSGTLFKLRESIERAGCEVEWLPVGLSQRQKGWGLRIFRKLFHGCPLWDKNALYFRMLANSIDRKRLKNGRFDFIFFPAFYQMACFLRTDIPSIGHGDATFRGMQDYYWKNLPPMVARMGNRIEKRGLEACHTVVRASDWAAASAVNDYGIDASKVKVLELGANFDFPEKISYQPYVSGGRLNVIFSGVDWQRKGGDVAVWTVALLRERGIDAHLYIMGIRELPDSAKVLDYIEHVGYLNKNNPAEYARYVECFSQGQLFLLPTSAECAGVVFSEASGFGIPSFTYDTGGVPNYVENGVNGYRLPLGAGAQAFADRILEVIDNGSLAALHEGALRKYASNLSWDAWAARFRKIIDDDCK